MSPSASRPIGPPATASGVTWMAAGTVPDAPDIRPSVTRATAVQRSPGVDERFDVELTFPSGATGLSTNSMVDDRYSFTLQVTGSRGDALVHNFINPRDDDRVTVRTSEGSTVEHCGTRASYTYQLEAFAAHVRHGAPLPLSLTDAVANMALVDEAYRAAGMSPR